MGEVRLSVSYLRRIPSGGRRAIVRGNSTFIRRGDKLPPHHSRMKRGIATTFRLACLLGAGTAAVPALAADAPPPGTILTNAAQVLALGGENAEQLRLPVKLRGV